MHFSNLNDSMLRQIIIDHYNNPRNKKLTNDKNYLTIRANSDSCIDDVTIELLVEDSKVKDIKFDGVACAICTASTDIISGMIINKNIEEALKIIDNYLQLIYNKPDCDIELLDEAIAFKNVYKQPTRIKCATLGINGIKELILKNNKQN